MALRAFGGPNRYLQGPDAINALGPATAALGRSAAVVLDPVAATLLGEAISAGLADASIAATSLTFGGEVTASEIDRLTDAARTAAAEVIIACGGGKAIDTAKGVAMALGRPLIVVPTIASNDAPTSTVIVVYTEDHRLSEVRRTPASPHTVIVDTQIIARAPRAFLLAGIGDGLSKTFEARQTLGAASGRNFFDGRPTEAALALADAGYRILRADAAAALTACDAGTPTPALERVVEACVLMSGLGFENGGLSLAHALQRGLQADPDLGRQSHGLLVAYALLVQVTLEERDAAFLADLRGFYRQIGLPLGTADFGVQMTPGRAAAIAGPTMAAPYIRHFQRRLTAETIARALLLVEQAASQGAQV